MCIRDSRYGADCFRMYEMFLGPIEQSKPWDTKGIEGVQKFLRKFWSLFFDDEKWLVNDTLATAEEKKVLHTTIKKVCDDIELSLIHIFAEFTIGYTYICGIGIAIYNPGYRIIGNMELSKGIAHIHQICSSCIFQQKNTFFCR